MTGPGKGVELAMHVSSCSDFGKSSCTLALKQALTGEKKIDRHTDGWTEDFQDVSKLALNNAKKECHFYCYVNANEGYFIFVYEVTHIKTVMQ